MPLNCDLHEASITDTVDHACQPDQFAKFSAARPITLRVITTGQARDALHYGPYAVLGNRSEGYGLLADQNPAHARWCFAGSGAHMASAVTRVQHSVRVPPQHTEPGS